MSKSLKEALAADPALADEFKAAVAKAVVEFANSKGLDPTENTELSPDDLEKVAGGVNFRDILESAGSVAKRANDVLKGLLD